MVIDTITQALSITPAQVRIWSDRHLGVGFDQLLLVQAPTKPSVDFCYRIFNADGSEVESCGNGARCFARFVIEKRLIDRPNIIVETLGGDLNLWVCDDGQVKVDMGIPTLEPAKIPFSADRAAPLHRLASEDGREFDVTAIGLGNPHCVLKVESIESAPVAKLGAEFEQHKRFPAKSNVGFLQVIDRKHGRLRVFERGVGETLACGTGACAAMAAGRINGWFDDQVFISLAGGELKIEWSGERLTMTGPATTVYEGMML